MKLQAIFLVFLTVVFHYAGSQEGASRPVVLFYYPERTMYLLSDVETAQFESGKKKIKFTKIILLCPTLNHTPKVTEKYLEIVNIFSALEKISVFEKCSGYSRENTSPFLIQDVTKNAAFTKGFLEEQYKYGETVHTISFHVRNDQATENILQTENLANTNFPNVDTYKNPLLFQIYILWIYFAENTHAPLKTYHRINVHNHYDRYPYFSRDTLNIYAGLLYYEKYNQGKIFKKFVRPGKETLYPHRLVPLEDFRDEYSRWATFTDKNVVPLWNTVSESMSLIEKYIQTINSVLPINTMSITTIVHDTLTLMKNQLWGKKVMEEVYLDLENSKIPVPKILIKIISYRVPFPTPEDEEERNFYTLKDPYKIAIVVHNEVTSISERICGTKDDNFCNQNGWYIHEKNEDSNAKNNIYCCSLDYKLFKEYGYDNVTNLPLNLNKVIVEKGDDQGEGTKIRDIVNELQLYPDI